MSLLSPTFKWTPSGVPYQMIYIREREHTMNEIVPNVTPATIHPKPVATLARDNTREDLFNEVIAGLSILAQAIENYTPDLSLTDSDGITLALEYVKAMQKAEQ